MPYVAVKGGEQAILNAEALLKAKRRGDPAVPELSLEQIKQQMQLAVNRVMAEGSLYDPDLAALAIKQSWGDLVEAAFLSSRLPHYPTPPLLQPTHQHRPHASCSGAFPPFLKKPPAAKNSAPPSTTSIAFWTSKLAAETNEFPTPHRRKKLTPTKNPPPAS